ncbi:hypothetical protein V8E55_003362 [Tylopilus felleus]
MPDSATAVRNKFGRFRILVIGRANAGKTTLIQRVCKTTESPIVRIYMFLAHTMLDNESQRGEHDIEHEISFKSNDRFVFHDSRGFEAGSTDELHKVQAFIEERANEQALEARLHAIWYCIPMDYPRPITVAEEFFFSEHGTGKVPVIVVFTKFDALDAAAFGELRDQGMSIQEAVALAPEHAKEIFERNGYYSRLQAMKFPPRNFVCMQGMHKEEADCSALLACTAEVLDDEMLENLSVSVQQVNLTICVENNIYSSFSVLVHGYHPRWTQT